ncbi:T9SS type A sorting domain-containing protein, partial [Draconibacterium sp.]|nr:T9SS type A sorting domain-containing protein [Draconibacterium sp.]
SAQEAISTSGGEASDDRGSVSYSIGQIVYSTGTGTNGSASEGVQQPYEIYVITGIEDELGINLMVSAYPNPTTNFLTLKVDNSEASKLSYYLYDFNGKLIENKKIRGNETRIGMSRLVPETYILKVIERNRNESKEIKTFKIIKN